MQGNKKLTKYHKEIESFLETEELLDIWTVINPNMRFYTWHQGNNRLSRLDYIFTSEHLLNVLSEDNIIQDIHCDPSLYSQLLILIVISYILFANLLKKYVSPVINGHKGNVN